MSQQPKQVRDCPWCGAPMKKNIGAQSRKKIWVCTNKDCGHRKPAQNLDISDRWYPR